MTPFDMLFFALLATLVLIIAGELWMIRPRRRKRPHDELEPWIQVWPPDDRR